MDEMHPKPYHLKWTGMEKYSYVAFFTKVTLPSGPCGGDSIQVKGGGSAT